MSNELSTEDREEFLEGIRQMEAAADALDYITMELRGAEQECETAECLEEAVEDVFEDLQEREKEALDELRHFASANVEALRPRREVMA